MVYTVLCVVFGVRCINIVTVQNYTAFIAMVLGVWSTSINAIGNKPAVDTTLYYVDSDFTSWAFHCMFLHHWMQWMCIIIAILVAIFLSVFQSFMLGLQLQMLEWISHSMAPVFLSRCKYNNMDWIQLQLMALLLVFTLITPPRQQTCDIFWCISFVL